MTMPTTRTICVPEIHCDHCKASIEGSLLPLPGVSAAEVDIPSRSVAVTYDEASVDQATLVRVIEEQGYQVPTR
jgi:copper chaperone